jgi:hypothetical protein
MNFAKFIYVGFITGVTYESLLRIAINYYDNELRMLNGQIKDHEDFKEEKSRDKSPHVVAYIGSGQIDEDCLLWYNGDITLKQGHLKIEELNNKINNLNKYSILSKFYE